MNTKVRVYVVKGIDYAKACELVRKYQEMLRKDRGVRSYSTTKFKDTCEGVTTHWNGWVGLVDNPISMHFSTDGSNKLGVLTVKVMYCEGSNLGNEQEYDEIVAILDGVDHGEWSEDPRTITT